MKLEQTLVKVFKFITFVFFTLMGLIYVGIILLLPLDVLFQVIRILHAIGLPTAIAAVLGMAGIGYLGLTIARMPALCELVVDIGRQIVDFGHAQIKRCDALLDQGGKAGA